MRGQGGATPDVESQAGEERAQEEEEGAEAAALASGPVVVNLGEEGQEAAYVSLAQVLMVTACVQ